MSKEENIRLGKGIIIGCQHLERLVGNGKGFRLYSEGQNRENPCSDL